MSIKIFIIYTLRILWLRNIVSSYISHPVNSANLVVHFIAAVHLALSSVENLHVLRTKMLAEITLK